MKFFILASLFVIGNATLLQKRAAGDQNPKVWDALKVLRGGKDLTVEDMQSILANAVAGKDYPTNSELPKEAIECAQFKQPGFYADDSATSKCQIFHRCDLEGVATSYLCPNMTLFNQITLICDWFYNIDCSQSKQFEDYSNSRLYQEGEPLLDNQDVIAVAEATGAATPAVEKKAAQKAEKKSGVAAPAAAGKKSAVKATKATTAAMTTTAAAAEADIEE